MKMPKQRSYPKEIWIGGHPWQIKFKRVVDKDAKGKPLDTVGLCDPSERIIYIQLGLSPTETLDVFIHEILHAIEDEYRIKLSAKNHRKGDRVYKLSEAIVDFLKNL